MKMHVTRRELLALTSFVVPKPTANLEQAHVRMMTWESLGVVDLAMQVADLGTFGKQLSIEPWLDPVPFVVDLVAPCVDFLLKQLEGEMPGVFSEVLRPLQDRLLALRDKNYKLPPELRPVHVAEPPADVASDA